jgi:hypothetical protein
MVLVINCVMAVSGCYSMIVPACFSKKTESKYLLKNWLGYHLLISIRCASRGRMSFIRRAWLYIEYILLTILLCLFSRQESTIHHSRRRGGTLRYIYKLSGEVQEKGHPPRLLQKLHERTSPESRGTARHRCRSERDFQAAISQNVVQDATRNRITSEQRNITGKAIPKKLVMTTLN